MADKIVVLRAGRIEQVGSPQALYETPSNVFVAGFMGSPRMNFVPAETARTAPSLRAWLPEAAQQVGIRPEHWMVCSVGEGLALHVKGTEYLGAQRLLHGLLHRNAVSIDLRQPCRVKRPCQGTGCQKRCTIALTFFFRKTHYFDPEGQTLFALR